jgi:predicted TIM-barrel fold metal-dependent hydrolase
MPALIDFHTHFFSRTLFEVLAAGSPLQGSQAEKLERATRSLGLELPAHDPVEHLGRWLAELDRHGVGHMVTFASVPEEVPILAEVAGLSRGRVTPFAIVDPLRPGAPQRLAGLLEERLFRGALLFPAMHRYRLDGPEAGEVFGVLAEFGAPAIVHCGLLKVPLRERLGLPQSFDLALANPLALVGPADRHPEVPFVVPHFGAGMFREVLIAGAQCPNVLVDTSSSNDWIKTQPVKLTLADVFERALGVFGTERILFGTDSSVFPRGWRRDLLLAQREALGACGVREEEQAKIFGGNASRILGTTG